MVNIYVLGAAALFVIVLVAMAWEGNRALGPDPDLRPRKPQAHRETVPGCFSCILAASASDEHLERHLRREHGL